MIGCSRRRALVSTIPDVDMSPLVCEQWSDSSASWVEKRNKRSLIVRNDSWPFHSATRLRKWI
jgi:hypothetical protein